ncbi:GTPase Obg 1 [Trebouxia sp. C0009 RCD-2024]
MATSLQSTWLGFCSGRTSGCYSKVSSFSHGPRQEYSRRLCCGVANKATAGNVSSRTKATRPSYQHTPGSGQGSKAGQFDEAIITVRSGAGGRGEIAEKGGGRMVDNFKYQPGGSLPKRIWLNNSDPADGHEGSSIILYVDPAMASLSHLHERSKWTGSNGPQGNPTQGTNRPKSQSKGHLSTAPTRIPVPPGTVVKKKRGSTLIADLTHPGESVVVARGGRGGLGVTRPTRQDNDRLQSRKRRFLTEADTAVSEYIVEDADWKAEAVGAPGEEVTLQLMLRVVADVGIVGYPNAGKSSLLAALTRASPEVAPYPFTTVTPNLGVTQVGGESEVAGQRLVLADLPGLIEGAHQGRGLGRMFLRHLRRTRIILHVVDAATDDPAMDYWAVREELRMYNPEYCARPHVVALNKMDLQDAAQLQEEIASEVLSMARRIQDKSPQDSPEPSLPAAIVNVSAEAGTGLEELQAALQPLLPSWDANEPAADNYLTNPQDAWA